MPVSDRQKINVVIAGPLNFPRPGAPTSRVTAYAKGLLENGADVTILCLRPVGSSPIPSQGSAEGIDYIYSAGVTEYQKTRWKQLYYEFKALFAAMIILIQLHRKQKVDVCLFYAAHIYHEVIFYLVTRVLGIKMIRDLCEYPFYQDRRQNLKLRIKGWFYETFIFKLFDGLIIMTRALEEYSKPFLRKKCRYVMVPILVDPHRFENVEPIHTKGRYIAYCGDPAGTKDGVNILIEAFSKVAAWHPDVKLFIIGDTADRRDPDFLKKLQARIDGQCGDDRVILTGSIDYHEIPKYLCGAYALVLARPKSVQAKYGFPTKLGEYLATGHPVIVTDVGEISDFIKEGVNGFITAPGDVEAFSVKLNYVLSHPDQAEQAGLEGHKLAREFFNYRKHGPRLVEFVKQLQKN